MPEKRPLSTGYTVPLIGPYRASLTVPAYFLGDPRNTGEKDRYYDATGQRSMSTRTHWRKGRPGAAHYYSKCSVQTALELEVLRRVRL
jgi:hypothetical protein